MTRIVLADDHPIVRQGLRSLLEKEPGFLVVGEASDGLEVADLVDEMHADVRVLDLLMPQSGHRRAAQHQRAHGGDAPCPHHAEAGSTQPHRTDRVCPSARAYPARGRRGRARLTRRGRALMAPPIASWPP